MHGAEGRAALGLSSGPLRTLALALGMLAVGLAASELVARTAGGGVGPLAAGVGRRHRHLEIQLAKLEALANQGPVDCLFVGSSDVQFSIDPELFAEAYRA